MTSQWDFDVIDFHSSVAVYVQMENQVRFAIASGQLKADERLPCVRELAERLGVNPNTVAKAYRDLQVMGLVYSRRGMGVFVNQGVGKRCREECHRHIIARIHEVAGEAKASAMSLKDVREIVEASFAMDVSPYGPTPDALLNLVKPAKRPR